MLCARSRKSGLRTPEEGLQLDVRWNGQMRRALPWMGIVFELWAWHTWLAFSFLFQAARTTSGEGNFESPLRILAVWPVVWGLGACASAFALKLGDRFGWIGCFLAAALGVAVLGRL